MTEEGAALARWIHARCPPLYGRGRACGHNHHPGSSGYRPYQATRAFWERNGFVHIDTIDPLPGWEPGNPAAIYVAALCPTR